MRAILHLFGGKDGRLSFGKLVVVTLLALYVWAKQVPDAGTVAALLLYAYGRTRSPANVA